MSGTIDTFRVLCLGDVVGRPGRRALARLLPGVIKERALDFVIVNGENAAGGLGLDTRCAEELYAAGADVITLGDHTWNRKDLLPELERQKSRLLRPANYPNGAPGAGWTLVETRRGVKIGVMNLIGRVFFNVALDCPFRKAEALLAAAGGCKLIFCDMHAEATSEKVALGRYLDGRVTCVFGTHTHVPTADETILPGGTAYVTDVGMCGSGAGVIGMDTAAATRRLLTGVAEAYQVAEGAERISGLYVEADPASGKALTVERFSAA